MNVTNTECHKQVRSWRLLCFLMEFLIPTCSCTFAQNQNHKQDKLLQRHSNDSSTITGTLFRYKRGKVHFCIQTNSMSTTPVLLLELVVPTNILAKEMQGGRLRIVFESPSTATQPAQNGSLISFSKYLFSTPVWNMYCNGKKVGYAVKRQPSKSDLEAMRGMSAIVEGTGVMEFNGDDRDEQLMYLRASFDRVCGSTNWESLHVFDPEGNIGQEMSIFFLRSHDPFNKFTS